MPRPARVQAISSLKIGSRFRLPFYLCRVPASFPSPADDHLEARLDLLAKLVRNKPATFIVEVSGDSMTGVGISHGDLLIVDRSLTPQNRSIVIACLDGEHTVKRFVRQGKKVLLQAENPDYASIRPAEETELRVWGVVTYVIHRPE